LFVNRIKNIILNQFFFTKHLDWLHFGFGMHAIKRENVARAIDANMAVSFRGSDLYLTPLKHPNCYNLLFKKCVKYHVLSEEMKQTLLEQSVSEQQIHVIPPAIDVNFFINPFLKESFNTPLRLTTVARLHWKKGLEYTLEALALLKDLGVAFEYTVVGTGDQYERLVFAAHQLGLSKQVHFVGQLPPEAVKGIYEKTDIYIQYSIQEGFCNAVLEAQAMGLLCVVSDAEGLPENILDNETGWVVQKRRPDLLKDAIINVLGLPFETLRNIRLKAIERVAQEFNLQKQQDSFIRFYEE